ncbi:hypothetical protein [Armatimonas rosea]|uniref:Uncharacterized protein n=1 Tax=Armatimonas rosea TaxID=685828 RepID=A0A7W9SML9_ARMRO|nr:hypothetical protein [Armatimonas rosea]MBB6048969.1 hypothetical protein [Armatimonas rosea]
MILSQNILEQSTTYQDIIARGARENSRSLVLDLGKQNLGVPTSEQVKQVEAIEDTEVLKGLIGQIFKVKTWNDLLAALPATVAPQN